MSKVNTILNNLKHFPVDQETSICFGELSVNIEDLDTFQIPGNIKSDSHIILTNSHSDTVFKDILSEAPLIGDYSVTVYDYSSTITNKYLKERVTNNPGTVNNKLSKINLLSQIKLPDVNKKDKSFVTTLQYPCKDHNDILFYKIDNGGHHWPNSKFNANKFVKRDLGELNKDFDTNQEIWNFVSRHEIH